MKKISAKQSAIKSLVRSQLTLTEISVLRDRYLAGKETIAELSQYTHCPPTLLYVILTPLADQTSYKLRMLRQELAIITLCCFGLTNKQIAKKLKLSEEEVREHTDAIVSDENFRLRPWYNNRVVPE